MLRGGLDYFDSVVVFVLKYSTVCPISFISISRKAKYDPSLSRIVVFHSHKESEPSPSPLSHL